MGRPLNALPCPNCEGLRTKMLRTDPDPDPPRGEPTVLRVRVCLDCGNLLASTEQLAPLDAVQRRILDLQGERTGDLRRMRKALAREPVSA